MVDAEWFDMDATTGRLSGSDGRYLVRQCHARFKKRDGEGRCLDGVRRVHETQHTGADVEEGRKKNFESVGVGWRPTCRGRATK